MWHVNEDFSQCLSSESVLCRTRVMLLRRTMFTYQSTWYPFTNPLSIQHNQSQPLPCLFNRRRGGISLPPSERCGRLETENKLNLKGNTLSLCSVRVSLSSLHRHSLLPTQSVRRKPQKRHPETALFGSLDWKYYPRSISGDTHALYNITSSPRNDFIFRTLSRSSSCQYSKRSSRWETLVGATVHSLFSSNRVVLTSCWSPPYSGSISFRKSSYSTWLSQRINFWRWWIHEFPWEFFNHLMLGWAY